MSVKCPQCQARIESPSKFCIKCGSELPIEATFTGLSLEVKSGDEMRIGESSVLECKVTNDSVLSVANVGLLLSCSRFTAPSECFVDKLGANMSEIVMLEVDVAKAGKAMLRVRLRGLVEGQTPVCYVGQALINPTQKAEIKTDSDPQKIIVNIGQDAMVDLSGGIRIDSGAKKQESPPLPETEWMEIDLRRDPSAERDWFEQIRAKTLRACPYCSGLIDMHSVRCEICSAPMPSWFAKRQEVLCESGHRLPTVDYADLTIPSLDNKVFRFHTSSRITWGRHSENDIHILFYDENGRLDRGKSKAVSNYAGHLNLEDGRPILCNKNRFTTRFMMRHTSEAIDLNQDERKELRQEGTLILSDLCHLDIKPFTSQRRKSPRQSAQDAYDRQQQAAQANGGSPGGDDSRRSSCFIWPDKNIEAIRIRRTDCDVNKEHILLENSASIGSGEGCCVRIPKSGVERNHARIIYYEGDIWLENCSNVPIKFEMGTTKHLRQDAIMKVNHDCTVRFGYLETHLKLHGKRKRMEEL